MKKFATIASAAVLSIAAGQASATVYSISGSFDVIALGFAIPFSYVSGEYDTDTNSGSYTATADLGAFVAPVVAWDQTFTLDDVTGEGFMDLATDCRAADVNPGADVAGACVGLVPAFTGPLTLVDGIFEGTNSFTLQTPNFGVFTFTPELTEVPVPAAAWLFGSALVGMAGLGRSRKK